MPITLSDTGVVFPDNSTQTTKFDTTMDTGKLLGVSTYTTAGTFTWSPNVPAITGSAVTWTASGTGVAATGSNPYTLTHSAAPSTWTQGLFSTESGTLVGAQASASQTNTYIMFGLSRTPGASYTTIEYALYYVADGTIQIYESGNFIGTFGTYNTNTVGRVTYDGSYIRYYTGRTGTSCIREVAVSGLTGLKFSSAFYNGGALNNVFFGNATHQKSNKILVKLTGAGGGGAGYCESGGAGGYAEKTIDVSAVANVTVTIGAGGTNIGYFAAAGNGGTTSFGSYCSATGGFGANRHVNHTGGHGGIGSSGDINLLGGVGTGHTDGAGGGALGQGGTSYWGGGRGVRHDSNNPPPGNSAPGAGGPGGRTDVNWQGGPGEPGAVVVYSLS